MKNIFRLSVIFASIALLFGCEQTVFDLYMAGPTNVTCKSSSSTPTSLTVTLSQSESADNPVMQYTVQLLNTTKDNPSEEDTTVTKTFSPGTSITFTNLTTGKCYYARVRVIYTMGRSEWVVSSNRVKVGKGTVGANESDDSTPNNNQIFYTTADERIIDISNYGSIGGSSILSNIYTNGVGIITCSEAIDNISEQFNMEHSLTSVTLPEIDTIEHSFTGCESLSEFTYYHNGSLVTRNYLACKNWLVAYAPDSNNTTFTIPSNIEVLGYQAFRSCRNLESVTIHSNVFSVGGATFYWCSNLKEVYCQRTTPPSAEGSGLFEDCNQLKIYVPNSALNAYKEADGWRYYSDRIFADPSTLTNNKIYYTSTDSKIVTPYSSSAFNGNITSNTYSNGSGVITFDTDITTFGVEAFKNCTTLKTIQIPNGVETIGTSAFYGCTALQNVSIPSSVTTIGNYAFNGCTALQNVSIPSSVTTIGSYAFNGCSSLTTVAIPSKVTTINSNTFYDCSSLTSVTIPNGVTSIGSSAFYRCIRLTSIAIPESVTSIGTGAFTSCTKLTRVDITSLEAWCNIAFIDRTSNPLYSKGGDIYLNGNLITDLVIPQSITKVKDSTFFRATSIASVTLHDNVTSIGNYTFQNCSALTTITIPESVTSIGNYSFYDCSTLTSVYCKPTTPPTLGGTYTFDNNPTDRKIYVPAASVDAYQSAQYWSEYASYIVPDAISETYKIYYTTTDGNVLTPYQTTGFNANIVSNTYENGQGVILFDAPLTTFGTYAFYNCTTITSVTMPESITAIGSYALRGCTSLTSCNIPNGVTTIDNYAFQNCKVLPNIAIPESVTSIGTGAFSSCTNLTRVDITSLTAWCNIAFSSTTSNPLYTSGGEIYHNGHPIINLYIPEGVTEIKNYAFYKATSIASVTLHEKVTSIGSYAFRYCSALTSCDIPNGLTTIYSYAFGQCSALTTITIPESVTTIGNSAFYYCSALANVYCKPTTPPTLGGTSVFDSNATDRKIYVPASSADAYKTATYWSEYADAITADYSSETNKIYYTSSDGNVVTPNKTDVFGANIISNTYENGQGIITFDSAVTSIGDYAFGSCSSLTSVIIGNSVTSIGYGAFYNCYSLTSVTISDSVTSIMNDAFGSCDNLAEFNGKFASADKRCLIVNGTLHSFAPAGLTEYTIPDSVTKIGWCIFQNYTSITSITIPNSVTSIEGGAFSNCGLTSVTIPDSVTSIKDGAFSGCDNLAEFNGKFASADKRCLIVNGTLNSFAPAGLTGYTIPNSVTAIGNVAFCSCNKLCSVTIPDSVTSIGGQAFDYCSKLIEVFCKPTTPPRLDDSSVFDKNATGRKIYVPAASVDAYKSAAYWSEYADAIVADDGSSDENRKIYYTTTDGNVLTPYQTTGFNANIVSNTYENGQGVITFDSMVTTIGASAFSGCTTLSSITIPAGVTSIGGSAFQNCTSLPSINIPVSITSIGSTAFSGCSNLKSVYIDDLSAYCKISFSSTPSVPTYNSAKLYVKGTELTKLTIPEDVTTIKYATFYKCSSIKSVVIGNHVTSIENYTFRYCPAITSVKIGNGVTTIGNYAFANCTALESVTIGSGVTKIGSGAFYNSSKLAVVRCKPTTPPTLGSTTTFDSNATDRVIYVPQAAVEAYQSATNWSEYASAIVADDNQVTPGDDINENQYPDEL